MRALGPLWGFALTVDRDLALVILAVNLVFSVIFVWLVFRRQNRLAQVLTVLGLFVVVTACSMAGLHFFARTPVRDIQFFALD